MEGKTVSASAIRGRRETILAGHLNEDQTLFGGWIEHILDAVAAEVAKKHSESICVTRGFIGFFREPVRPRDDLRIWASVNRVWRSSLEVGLRFQAEDRETKKRRDVGSAYYHFVVKDRQTRMPVAQAIPVIPQTKTEKRRFEEAEQRKALLKVIES